MTRRLVRRVAAGIALLLATGACGREAHGYAVAIESVAFAPRVLEIGVGDTVTWTNGDIVPHTVTFDDAPSGTDHLEPGQTRRIIGAERDTMEYRCRYHPSMTGTVVVR